MSQTDKKPPLIHGERIYKVFHCHGCQTCWKQGPDGEIVEHPHILSREDITEEYATMKQKLGAPK